MIKIIKIAAIATHPIRILVLRKGQTLDLCPFDGDDLPTTIHLGLYFNNNLIGIVSVFKVNNTCFEHNNQFQIRGMAVLDYFQNQGYGKLLIKAAENIIYLSDNSLIWLNAREVAFLFYEKLGYIKVGEPFLIEGIGTHHLMKK